MFSCSIVSMVLFNYGLFGEVEWVRILLGTSDYEVLR